jgi:uncharacterized protein YneF (UPF0154 family)
MTVQPPMTRTANVVTAPRRKRRIWLSILLGVVIFACGAVVGVGAALYVVQRMVAEIVREPDRMADRMARHMERKLRLSGEQKAQVEAILKRRIDGLLDIRRDVRPRIAEQIDLLEQEMRDVLTDDQMHEWESQLKIIKSVLVAPEDEDGT